MKKYHRKGIGLSFIFAFLIFNGISSNYTPEIQKNTVLNKIRMLRIIALLGCMTLTFSSTPAQTQLTTTDLYTGKADVTASQWVKLSPGFRAAEGCNVHVYISSDAAAYQPIVYSPTPGGSISAGSPNASANYIRTTTLRAPVSDEANISPAERVETVAYFDGLGRPVQTVTVQGSPSKNDLVEALAYDKFGRDSIHFLPFAKASNNGAFVPDAKSAAVGFYSSAIAGHESTSLPWNKTRYEASPLNRVTGSSGPGAWDAKPTAVSFLSNAAAIDHWDAAKNAFSFAPNSLYMTETSDEDGNKSREYKDKLGQVVRRENYDGTNWLRTAYVYDDFGQLVIVVPPKASSPADTELCFFYSYDARRRLIVKDLPGADPVYLVYDNRDRLVLSQDGVQRPANKWSFTKYDALNRPVFAGELVIADTRENIAAVFAAYSGSLFETSGNVLYGYSNQSFPAAYNIAISPDNVLSATYYDDYSFRPAEGYNYQSNLAGEPSAESAKTRGLVTGTRVKVLPGGESLVNPMALTVNYYDDFGQLVQSVSDNHFDASSKDVVHTAYNFAGQVVKSVTEHRKGNAVCLQTLAASFSYDHQGRLLTSKMKINADPEITLSSLAYNELGEMVARFLHGDASGNNFNQKVDFVYNARGWLRSMNSPGSLGSDLMALDLRYNEPRSGSSLGGSALFNGNISQLVWDTGSPAGYGFSYDGLSRLRSASYADGSALASNAGKFSTTYSYDANGNLSSLSRFLDGALADNLSYSYYPANNRLQSVSDASGSPAGYKAASGNYLFDYNGNMTFDVSKGFAITYNRLNLPLTVSVAGDFCRFTYDASGTKLNKMVFNSTAGNYTRFDYCGPFLYENSVLKCIFTPEGRIVVAANQPGVLNRFEYNLNDHLGNSRVTFTGHAYGKPEVNQITSYDPFGLVTAQSNFYPSGASKNKLLYNGKELQDEALAGNKIDWYDFGARFYDPELGRWHSVDPLAEKYRRWSPYNYGKDNPLRFIDPDGNSVWDVINGAFRGVADNLLGTDTRSSYEPDDADDYNGALDQADRTSLLVGASMAVGGTGASIGGVVAAPETLGASLVISAVGAGVAAEGRLTTMNSARHLMAGNNYGEKPQQTSSRQNPSKAEGGTVWNAKDKSGGRIDWEKPAGNNQKGQVHYQSGKDKYIYDANSKQFLGKDSKTGKWDAKAPRSVQDLLKNKDIQNAIQKGQRYIGN